METDEKERDATPEPVQDACPNKDTHPLGYAAFMAAADNKDRTFERKIAISAPEVRVLVNAKCAIKSWCFRCLYVAFTTNMYHGSKR